MDINYTMSGADNLDDIAIILKTTKELISIDTANLTNTTINLNELGDFHKYVLNEVKIIADSAGKACEEIIDLSNSCARLAEHIREVVDNSGFGEGGNPGQKTIYYGDNVHRKRH